MRADEFQVVALPSPLKMLERRIETFAEGTDLRTVLKRLNWRLSDQFDTRILVNDQRIEDLSVAPDAGDFVCVIGVPKDPITLFIAFSKFLLWAGVPAGTGLVGAGATLMTAGVYVGAAYGIQGLAQSVMPDQDFGRGPRGEISPTLDSAGNALRPFEPVPDVYGQHRIFPPHGARPFTETVGDITYARMIFLISHGPVDVTSIRIGELPIDSYSDVEYNLREGRTGDGDLEIFTHSVIQIWPSRKFNFAAWNEPGFTSFETESTAEDIQQIAVEIAFDEGLWRYNENGKAREESVYVDVEYRNVSGGSPTAWTKAHTASDFTGLGGDGNAKVQNSMIYLLAFKREPFIKTFKWTVDQGQYEVRVRRVEAAPANVRPGGPDWSASGGAFLWRSLRGYRFDQPPIDLDELAGVATLEVRLPLTDQTGGFVNNLSAIAYRELRIYDPGHDTAGPWDSDEWTTVPYPTRNPAAAFRAVFQGSSIKNPVADSDLDIEAISAWYTQCETDSRYLDLVVDQQMTAPELARSIARSARADLDMVDGKISVVQDIEKTTPVQLISARNCNSFSMERSFAQTPHGLVMRHINPEEGYEPNWETPVYADGYSADNATNIETVSLVGAWTPDDAWKEGRYLLAVHQLRPRSFTITMDMEALAIKRRDLVLFAHDGALIGQSAGRVKALNYALFDDCEATTGWTALAGCSIDTDTAIRAKGTKSLTAERTASGSGTAGLYKGSLGGEDWSDTILKFWVRLDATAYASLGAADGFRLAVDDTVGGNDTEWGFGSNDIPAAHFWYPLEVDLDNDAPVVAGGVDTTDIDEVKFYLTSTAQGSEAWIDQIETVANPDADISSVVVDNEALFQGGRTYKIQFQVVKSSPAGIVITEKAVTNPVALNDPDEWHTALTLASAISSDKPIVGTHYAFGETELVTRECLVDAIRFDSELQATVRLVDYAPAVFQADQGEIPDFDPGSQMPVPYKFLGPPMPEITKVVADENALYYNEDGSLVPQIIVTIAPAHIDSTRPTPAHYETQIRQIVPETGAQFEWMTQPVQPASRGFIAIQNINEGFYYDLRVRGISVDGRPSEYATWTGIYVSGKLNPPPDVTSFRIEGNVLMWQLPYEPRDLAGFRIRTIGGSIPKWDEAQQIHSESLVASSPWVMDSTPYGERVLMIKAVDVGDNESENPGVIFANLGDPPTENIIQTVDYHALGFPRISDENAELWDGCESTSGWTPVNGTLTLTTDGPVSGTYYFKHESTGGGWTRITKTFSAEDWTGKNLRFWVLPTNPYTYSYLYGLIVWIEDASSNMIQMYYDEGGVGGTAVDGSIVVGKWNVVECNFEEWIAKYGAPFDLSQVVMLRFQHNVLPAQDPNTHYFDHIELVGGGDLETTQVEVGTGDLVTIQTGNFWTDDETLFWSGIETQKFWFNGGGYKGGGYGRGTYRFEMVPEAEWTPSVITISMNSPVCGSYLEYQAPSDILFWKEDAQTFWEQDTLPFWSGEGGFVPWPGSLDALGREKYVGRLTMLGGAHEGRITQFDVTYDVPSVVEYFEDISIAGSGDPRLVPTKTFEAIESVTVTIQDAVGSEALIARVIDKSDPVAGAIVHVVNASNARRAAVIDAVMKGY